MQLQNLKVVRIGAGSEFAELEIPLDQMKIFHQFLMKPVCENSKELFRIHGVESVPNCRWLRVEQNGPNQM